MQIHELPAQTTAADADALAIDNGSTTQKITVSNIGKKITEDATPAFASGDEASPSAWSDVSVVTSGTALKTILNRVTTMMKNVRWLYKMLGTTDVSAISDGTVTGAISKFNTDLAGKFIQTGIKKSVSIPANGYADIEFTFARAFSDTDYSIAITPEFYTGVNYFSCLVRDKYQVLFHARVYNSNSSALTLTSISYIAIGN